MAPQNLTNAPRDIRNADWPVPPPSNRSGIGFRTRPAPCRDCDGADGLQGGGLHDFLDYFDSAWCVNLDKRRDRWTEFKKKMDAVDWPFRPIVRQRGVDGRLCPSPRGWCWGPGAWGCMQSHRQILEKALMSGKDRILVMEDDAYFVKDFGDKARDFLKRVPDDWECLMLGGQHIDDPKPFKEGVVACTNTQRTHAYALQGPIIKDLYQEWSSRMGHCDHIMGPFCGKRKTYAPSTFLVGQDAGFSDIRHGDDPPRLWQPPHVEVHAFIGSRDRFEEIIKEGKYHGGYSRNKATGVDLGLEEIFSKNPPDYQKLKEHWVPMLSWEAESVGKNVLVWHTHLTREDCREAGLRVIQ